MCQLMHHDHLNLPEAHPAIITATEDKLDDFAVVEVPTNEFAVGLVLFEGCAGEVVVLHDREALRGNCVEEGVCVGIFSLETWRAGERFDERDPVIWVGGGGVVQAEDVDGHVKCRTEEMGGRRNSRS